MTHFRKRIVVGFRLLLLLLFVGYYSSVTLFFHAHLVNGVVVVHSHPFQKSTGNGPTQSHSHSSSALVLIQHLNQLLWESGPAATALPEPVVFNYEGHLICNLLPATAGNGTYTQLRAPPVA